MTDPHATPEPLPVPGSFRAQAEALGVVFEGDELDRFGRYLALLLGANARMNLTSITDPDEMWTRHILDSLTLMAVLSEAPEGGRIADIGSGGGAPGIPLAIAMPHLRFTLIEATGKKASFLREASAALGCANVEVVADRAETLGQDREHWRESFDVVTARAVGRVAVVAELCAPLAKVGGLIALIKGERAEEELDEARQALHALHLSYAGIVPTPTGRIVVLEKARKTPRVYPRRPGEPKRAPLGVTRAPGTDDARGGER